MSDNHPEHDHEPGQPHVLHPGMEADAELGYYPKRAQAIEALLIEKGDISRDEVQRMADEIDARSPADGARVVARAWVDPEFKARLLANPRAAVAELGYTIPDDMPQLVVVENKEEVHHLVVCTLCSCYPRSLLGRPPDWYKSLTYRSRAVVNPRRVLGEFGLELDDSVEVRVLDSTADMRYLVLPRRPAGTEHLNEGELMKLVTRDSMIGVAHPRSPEPTPAR